MDTKRITGIILAGGENSRMGRDKGFLKLDGETYTEILLRTLKKHFQSIMIIANNSNYKKFNVDVFEDEFKNKGPLAGIYTGLKNCKTEYCFFTPCDSPFLSERLIGRLINTDIEGMDAVIPTHKNRIFPLTAIYSKSCLDQFKDALLTNRLKVKLEVEKLKTNFVEFDDSFEQEFININTPNDLNKIK